MDLFDVEAADKPTMFLYARTLPKRAGAEYVANDEESSAGAATLERLAKALEAAVRGPEAKRELEKAEKEKRDANSLKIYAQNQRAEIDGTSARLVEDTRAHIGMSL